MRHAAKVRYHTPVVVGSMLVSLLLGASSAPAAAQVDSARLIQMDRAALVQFVDRTPPPGGKFQIASNASFFQRLGWTNQEIWMYTDDQRFDIGGNRFGPVAFIAPSDNLERYSEADFDQAGATGLVVGAILVDTTRGSALMEPYTSLNLVAGSNCIRVSKVELNWLGYVYPPVSGDGDPCSVPQRMPPPLRVWRAAALPVAGKANIPPVARWHEGRKSRKDAMHFGLKCGDQWCVVIPPAGYDTLRFPHKDDRPNERTWETHGWHDVQRLAVMDGARAVPGRLKASIIPAPGLDAATREGFDKDWVHAATVVIKQSLSSDSRLRKYGRPPAATPDAPGYWGYLQGENRIYLRTTGDRELSPSGWLAEVRHDSLPKAHQLMVVERHDHKPKKLWGTARFRWLDHDDGDWIECDDGCCKIGVML